MASHLAGSTSAEVRDLPAFTAAMQQAQPDVVFHLAAQPLVRRSYAEPLETYTVNVMGTAHLFEAVRRCKSVVAVVNVTTDKCYENREWVWPYHFGVLRQSAPCLILLQSAHHPGKRPGSRHSGLRLESRPQKTKPGFSPRFCLRWEAMGRGE